MKYIQDTPWRILQWSSFVSVKNLRLQKSKRSVNILRGILGL